MFAEWGATNFLRFGVLVLGVCRMGATDFFAMIVYF